VWENQTDKKEASGKIFLTKSACVFWLALFEIMEFLNFFVLRGLALITSRQNSSDIAAFY